MLHRRGIVAPAEGVVAERLSALSARLLRRARVLVVAVVEGVQLRLHGRARLLWRRRRLLGGGLGWPSRSGRRRGRRRRRGSGILLGLSHGLGRECGRGFVEDLAQQLPELSLLGHTVSVHLTQLERLLHLRHLPHALIASLKLGEQRGKHRLRPCLGDVARDLAVALLDGNVVCSLVVGVNELRVAAS